MTSIERCLLIILIRKRNRLYAQNWAYFLFKGHKNRNMFFFYKKYVLIELQKQKGWETYARNKKFNQNL